MGDTMKVRGWLMIGPPEASRGLPPDASGGTTHYGTPPDTMHFEVGCWILWAAAPGQAPICLVCVEVPL
jgi:hypothetical protein